MSTVLQLKFPSRRARTRGGAETGRCEIVIFPGVRIERHDLDLGHRVCKTTESGDFGGLDGSRRRRKSS